MRTPRKAAVIGDGGWGTALAMLLLANGHKVRIWGPFPEYIETIKRSGENTNFLPGVALPRELEWTADRAHAVEDADVVVLAVPTKYYRSVLETFAGLISEKSMIVSVSKGLDQQTHKRMTEVAHEFLRHSPIAALSGPSLADEVARRIPTAVTIAAKDQDLARELQGIFTNDRFRVYSSDDIKGVEYGGAFKNVIAVAVGMSDGIGFGDNTRAALITRGLVEITRLGMALGAKHSTFAGLSGMGDLIVTCTSRHSRNHAVGERLGKGETLDHILKEMKQVAEGIWNCSLVLDLARKMKVEVPITQEVYSMVHKGKKPQDAVVSLMTRDLKAEG